MEIEDNQDEFFAFIHCWMEEVRELLMSWIAQGESKSKSTESKLEFEMGHLENCWEAMMEEIETEDGQMWEITNLKARLEGLSSEVGRGLKESRNSSAEIEKYEGMEVSDREERDDFKETPPNETLANAISSPIAAPQQIDVQLEAKSDDESEADKSGTAIDEDIVFQIDGVEVGDLMKMEKTDLIVQSGEEVDLKSLVPSIEVTKVDLKVRSRSVLELEHLGPPPWSKKKKGPENEDDEGNQARVLVAMAGDARLMMLETMQEEEAARVLCRASDSGLEDKEETRIVWVGSEIGPDPNLLGPPPWPNYSFIFSMDFSLKPGPILLPAIWKKKERYILGLAVPRSPSTPVLKPPPPPQPPDYPPEHSGIVLISSIVGFGAISYSVSIPLNGNLDAAGDPGNTLFNQQPGSTISGFDFKDIFGAEGIGNCGGITQNWVDLESRRHLEELGRHPEPLLKTPPHMPIDAKSPLFRVASRKDAASDDPGNDGSFSEQLHQLYTLWDQIKLPLIVADLNSSSKPSIEDNAYFNEGTLYEAQGWSGCWDEIKIDAQGRPTRSNEVELQPLFEGLRKANEEAKEISGSVSQQSTNRDFLQVGMGFVEPKLSLKVAPWPSAVGFLDYEPPMEYNDGNTRFKLSPPPEPPPKHTSRLLLNNSIFPIALNCAASQLSGRKDSASIDPGDVRDYWSQHNLKSWFILAMSCVSLLAREHLEFMCLRTTLRTRLF